MNGEFNSYIKDIRNNMALEPGNILRNSSFSDNLDYWVTADSINFWGLDSEFVYANGDFVSEKSVVADIITDGDRSVLRLRASGVTQRNQVMNFLPHEETGGSKYSFAIFCKAITAGTLSVGIEGAEELYLEQELSPATEYQRISKVGTWDEHGDFVISFTGEIYVYGASLFYDEIANATIELSTQIQQTAEQIKLMATKEYVDSATGAVMTSVEAELSVMAGEIALRATQEDIDTATGAVKSELEGKITVQADRIDVVVTDIDNINNTIETAGWITKADGNTLYASKSLENGNKIISYINQTATTLTISANRIDLNGAVTFNSLGYSLQQTIDGKVNRDDVGDLAYRNDVSYSYLDSWLRDYVDGKASTTDLAEYVLTTELNSKLTGYEKVGAAEDVQDYLINVLLNGTTTILGGYISTDLINADWIIANAASIGGFTIMSNELTGDGMTLNPSTGIFFEGNNTSAAIGSSVISGATGVKCPMVAKNMYGSGGYYDNGAALILVVGAAAYNETSQMWLSCQHDGGYGSKFTVESRYVSETSDKSFNSTVINLGHLLQSGQAGRINSAATTKSYLCLMSDNDNNSYLCIDRD